MKITNVLRSFIRRDFLISTSYRLAFLFDLAGLVFAAAGFFLISKMVGGQGAEVLRNYQGSYMSFVIIGLAFSGYMTTGLYAFTGALHTEQYLGTLERLFLLSPAAEWQTVLALGSYAFISGTVRVFGYLLAGALLFGVDFSNLNPWAGLITVFLSVTVYMGLGAGSAGFTILFKRGNPLDFVITGLMTFFGGIYFPVELLPGTLRWISNLVPMTHSLYALRMSLLNGYSTVQLGRTFLILTAFAVICMGGGILFLKEAIRRAKINGSLGTQ